MHNINQHRCWRHSSKRGDQKAAAAGWADSNGPMLTRANKGWPSIQSLRQSSSSATPTVDSRPDDHSVVARRGDVDAIFLARQQGRFLRLIRAQRAFLNRLRKARTAHSAPTAESPSDRLGRHVRLNCSFRPACQCTHTGQASPNEPQPDASAGNRRDEYLSVP